MFISNIDKCTNALPQIGRLEFFVDCSANATPEFEGRGGESLSTEMSRTLAHAYNDRKVFDLKSLSILPGKHCWLLYVDILVNIIDPRNRLG